MANNFTQFSEGIEGITPEERAWIESQLDANNWDPDSPPGWDAPLDDGFVGFEWEFQEISPSRELNDGERYLWIYSEEAGYPDHVGKFVQAFLAKFRPGQCFALTFSDACSKPRVGEFSGGGLFVTEEGYEVFDAYQWVERRLEQFRPERGPQPADQLGDISAPILGALSPSSSQLSTYFIAIWGQPYLQRYIPAPPHRSGSQRSYLLRVWGGTDEELSGPFASEAEIESAAAPYRDEDHSIFRLDIADRPSVHYLGGGGFGVGAELFGPFVDDAALEAAVAPYFHHHHEYAVFGLEIVDGTAQVFCWSGERAEEVRKAYPCSPPYFDPALNGRNTVDTARIRQLTEESGRLAGEAYRLLMATGIPGHAMIAGRFEEAAFQHASTLEWFDVREQIEPITDTMTWLDRFGTRASGRR